MPAKKQRTHKKTNAEDVAASVVDHVPEAAEHDTGETFLPPPPDRSSLLLPGVPRLPNEEDADYIARAEKVLDGQTWLRLDNKAVRALERILDDPDNKPTDVIATAKLILEHHRGKPTEKHEFSGPNQGPIMIAPISPEQLDRFASRHARAV